MLYYQRKFILEQNKHNIRILYDQNTFKVSVETSFKERGITIINKTKNVEFFVRRVELLILVVIFEKFVKFPKSEPRDSYKLDTYKTNV